MSRWLRPDLIMEARRLLPELFSFHLLPGQLDQSELCVRNTEPMGSRQGTLILRWVGGIKIRIEHRALRRKSRHMRAIITHSA